MDHNNDHSYRKFYSATGYVIDPASLNWIENEPKIDADENLFRTISFDLHKIIAGSKDFPASVLSMPGATWRWEDKLVSAFPTGRFDFMGLERDAAVHSKLLAETRSRGMIAEAENRVREFRTTEEPQDLVDYINTTWKDDDAVIFSEPLAGFDIIYLDWMGTWSKEKISNIRAIMDRGLLKTGGLMIATMSLRRGRKETCGELDKYKELPCRFRDHRNRNHYVGNSKVCGIPCRIPEIAAEYRQVFTPLDVEVYYSNTNKSRQTQPQLRLVLRRDA